MAKKASKTARGRSGAGSRGGSDSSGGGDESPLWRQMAWWGLVAVWVFCLASLASYDAADPPGHAVAPRNSLVENWCGPVGATVAHGLIVSLGAGAWTLVVGVGIGLGVHLFGRPVDQPILRGVGLLLFSVAIAGFQALFWPASGPLPEGGGGLAAIAGVAELTARFSTLGSALWIFLALLVGATLAFDRWLRLIPALVALVAPPVGGFAWRGTRSLVERGGAAAKAARDARAERVRLNDVDDDERVAPAGRARRGEAEKAGARRRRTVVEVEEDDEVESARSAPAVAARAAAITRAEDAEDRAAAMAALAADDEEELEEDGEESLPGAPQVFDPDALRQKISRLPVRFAGVSRRIATDDDMRDLQGEAAALEGYQFPGLDLLEDPEDNYSEKMEAFVRDQATALEEALRVYRIDGEVVGIDSGPVITMYEVKLAPGTKVAQLTAIASDLARALKAINIRIVSNMQGRDTVGIEVPNAVKEKVRLKELMSHSEKGVGAGKMNLPMFLGKDAQGEPLIEDLTQMPHMLIAGTTGSGKSVCMNTIIMSFLYTKKPNELKLVLIDPKMVEMSQFRDIPHLMCPVVTEMSKACAILEWAVAKMDERYELLAEAGVRDISAYNALPWEDLKERFQPQNEQEEARIPRKLPYIVFVIDELADLMMTQKEVEGSIVRIAQKARAVGIHLVLATQRPQANVVTGLIKSNMPGRISFKVASGMDSRIVLDQKGGELLLGQGDMLFLSPRSHKLMRAQGTLVEDRETRKVVRFLKDVAAPSFERQLVQLRSGDAADDAMERSLENAQSDPLFDKAVEIVLETKRGSVSLLQRRLAIGYTRASRLIDLMGLAGIIGDHKGTVAREIAITREEWEAMKAQAAADAAAAEAAENGAPAGTTQRQQSLFPEPAPAVAAAALKAPVDEDAEAEGSDEEYEEEYEEEEDDAEDESDDEAAGEDDEEWEYEDDDGEEGEEGDEEEGGEEEDELEEDEEWEYVEVDEEDGEAVDEEEEEEEGVDEEEDAPRADVETAPVRNSKTVR